MNGMIENQMRAEVAALSKLKESLESTG